MDRYIKEDELLEVIDKWQDTLSPRTDTRDGVIFDTLESVNFHIDNLATADVVEVVRCADCEYNGIRNQCPLLNMSPYRDDDRGFCSEGKRLE